MNQTDRIMAKARQLAGEIDQKTREEILTLPYGKAWLQTLQSLNVFLALPTAERMVKASSK